MAYTTIDKPSDYFDSVLYTGNGSTQSITGVGFQPDLLWIRNRFNSGRTARAIDSVRGVGKLLNIAGTADEDTQADTVTSFDSDGFSLGADSSEYGVNDNTGSHVAWSWKAGTSFTNDASATGIGSIDSSGSVNTDAGFSIISYTGTGSNATVGHGLGVTPKMVIVRRRDSAGGWETYHSSVGATKYIELNSTDAPATNSTLWQDTAPTSSVFSIGTNGSVNNSGGTYIAYCFADVQGYSKFGSYTANNNSDGAYIHLGFKPALFICKKSSGTESWYMNDNKRSAFNPTKAELYADNNQAEGTGNARIDLLSSGVKMRTDNGGYNTGSETYIYMAFAEEPFVTSTGVPACAR